MARFLMLLSTVALLLAAPGTMAAGPARPAAPASWRPGTYSGRFTIASNHIYSMDPLPPGMEIYKFDLRTEETTGTMRVEVGQQGTISLQIRIPMPFTYTSSMRAKDDGTGCCCLGHDIWVSGRGTATFSGPPGVGGSSFTPPGRFAFSLTRFSGGLKTKGPNCPSLDMKSIRSSIEADYAALFGQPITINVLSPDAFSPTDKSYAGTCDLPGWGYDPYRAFVCTWYVERVPAKRR